MKILFLGSKEYPIGTNTDDTLPSGGIEEYVQGLVFHLSKKKDIKITVITRRFSNTPRYEKKGNIEIIRVPWLKGFYFRNISFNLISCLKSMGSDFDLIHTNGPIAAFFGIILSKLKRITLITSPHGLALKQPQYNISTKKFFAIIERFAYSLADYVVFSSENEKVGFEEKLGFLPKKYKIIHSGVEVKRFEGGDAEKIKKDYQFGNKLVITFIGRLIEVKGLRYLIEAISHLKGDFILLIVGGGALRKELEINVSKKGLGASIIFAGRVKSIVDIMAATDIFVLPSLSEGLPQVLLEAMAAGKACVVTDIGLPVEDHLDALVVKASDSIDLARALQKLLDNDELRKKLGENANKKVKQYFSWEDAAESYLKLYNELRIF
jgi:glycosyltransferase involved in cell wall biosynthesis